MVRIGDDLENRMVVDSQWILPTVITVIPLCECDVCGRKYEPKRGDWDWICPECADKARGRAVNVLREHLSKDDLSVVEDLWEIYARVR